MVFSVGSSLDGVEVRVRGYGEMRTGEIVIREDRRDQQGHCLLVGAIVYARLAVQGSGVCPSVCRHGDDEATG